MKVMRFKGTKYSHKAIEWATIFAPWCWYQVGNPTIRQAYLNLFGLIAECQSFQFQASKLELLKHRVEDVLITLEGCLPPSESRITRHELIHVVESIMEIGPPKLNNMFKYERVNLYCKQLIKNRYFPMGSMAKNLTVRVIIDS
jgi:hypothetical protein